MPLQYDIRDRYSFEYTNLTNLRNEGLTSGELSDTNARKLIKTMSKVINKVTGQWFWPIESKERLSGDGYSILTHPSQIPILEVRSIATQSGFGGSAALPADNYSVSNRDIHLNNYGYTTVSNRLQLIKPRFSDTRPLNIIVDGTWGWLENKPYVADPFDTVPKVATTTSAVLTDEDTSIAVVDETGFRVGDVVIFRSGAAGSTYSGHAILTGVASNLLSFDAIEINSATLASGANVVTYGQIPEAVERACLIIVIKFKDLLDTDAALNASLKSRTIRERTDNYEYQLSKLEGSISNVSTGDAQADRLLSSYHSPPYLGAV